MRDQKIIDATFEVVSEPEPLKPPLDWRWKFYWIRIGLALFGILAFMLLSSPGQPESRQSVPNESANYARPASTR